MNKYTRWFPAFLMTTLAACGGGGGPTDTGTTDAASDIVTDQSTTETGNEAGADAPLEAAVDAVDTTPDAGCTFQHVIVTVSDYAAFGGYVVGDLATRTMSYVPMADAGSGIDQDHVVRSSPFMCQAYDLWRSSPGKIQWLDSANLPSPTQTLNVADVPTGADGGLVAANPWDIAVISPVTAYVAQYNSPRLLTVNPTAGTSSGTIDLSPFADADGIPEAASIALRTGRAYVAVQQLDRPGGYVAPANSHVAVIDTATQALVDVNTATTAIDGIALSAGNPGGWMPVTPDGKYMLVVSTGNWGVVDGAVDVVDLMSNTVLRSITPAMLGGEPGAVELVSGNIAWVTVDATGTDGGVEHRIVSFDLSTGIVRTPALVVSTTHAFGALRRAPDGTMWAIGSDYNAGSIHVFDATTAASLLTFTTGSLNTTSIDFQR